MCLVVLYFFFVQLNDTAGLRKQPRMLKFLCHSSFSGYDKNKVQPNIFHNILVTVSVAYAKNIAH